MNKIFSLIIPHYNIPKLLDRLLSTVPRREDLQVIVVDDCSSENLEIFKLIKLKYNWIEFLSTESNGGGGKARNIGLKHAKGKYIFFADADDFFLPNINEVLDDYKDSNANIDIIFFNAISLYSDTLKPSYRGRDWQNLLFKYGNVNKLETHLRYLFGEPWCKLIKKTLIDEHQISFEEISIHNDTYFSYMIGYFAKEIKIDNRAIYCIIDRQNSVSKNIDPIKLLLKTEVFCKKELFFKNNNIKIVDFHILDSIKISKGNKILNKEIYSIFKTYGIKKKSLTKYFFLYYKKRINNKIKLLINKLK